MDFLKKHYEKLVLSIVLLAVAVAAFLLTVEVGNVKQTLADQLQQKIVKKGAVLPPLTSPRIRQSLPTLPLGSRWSSTANTTASIRALGKRLPMACVASRARLAWLGFPSHASSP